MDLRGSSGFCLSGCDGRALSPMALSECRCQIFYSSINGRTQQDMMQTLVGKFTCQAFVNNKREKDESVLEKTVEDHANTPSRTNCTKILFWSFDNCGRNTRQSHTRRKGLNSSETSCLYQIKRSAHNFIHYKAHIARMATPKKDARTVAPKPWPSKANFHLPQHTFGTSL